MSLRDFPTVAFGAFPISFCFVFCFEPVATELFNIGTGPASYRSFYHLARCNLATFLSFANSHACIIPIAAYNRMDAKRNAVLQIC